MPDKILVVGSINHDSVYRVTRLPRPHETITASEFVTAPGGKGANQAAACALATETRVQLLGCVGKDMHGEFCLSYLCESGVDVSAVKTLDALPTGTACIMVEESGNNFIVISGGANSGLLPEHIEDAEDLIRGAGLVLTQLEVPLATVRQTLLLARKHDKRTILNPAPYVDGVEKLMGLADVFTPNQAEAGAIAELDVTDVAQAKLAAKRLQDMGANDIVMTLGGDGCLVVTQDLTEHVPAYTLQTVVDTSGAGDVLSGALAAALVDGGDLVEATDFASAAAALSVQKPTASHCAPTRRDVELFRQGYKR